MQISPPRRAYSYELGRFFLSWMQNPRGVGALAPSGPALSRLMVAGLGPGARVLELGSGTGTVTRAILASGVAANDLLAIECDAEFVGMLRNGFPGVQVVSGDAAAAARLFRAEAGRIDCIVSSLPVLLLTPHQRLKVLLSARTLLERGGVMHQFTYGFRCPFDRALLRRAGLQASYLGTAAANLPPARVYRIAREAA